MPTSSSLHSAYEEVVEGVKNVAYSYNPLLTLIASEVEDDIRLRGGNVPCSVFVGGFPLGTANACIMPVADGALVLFNHGLMQLIYQIGKVFLLSYDWLCVGTNEAGDVAVCASEDRAAPWMETAAATLGWAPCGWTRQQSVAALNAILHAYISDETVTTAPRQQLPTDRRALTLAALVHNAEKFVLAHEFAHLLLGHCHGNLIDLPTPAGMLSGVSLPSQEHEFQADELATSLLLASCDWRAPDAEFDTSARVGGIALFFASAALMALALSGASGFGLDAQPSDTHPTPNARLLRLLKFVHGRYGRSGTKLARVCMGWLFRIIEDVASRIADR